MDDVKSIPEILMGLLGGLALFIFGMNFMGEGLKKAAGERMRRILEIITGNPIIGVLVGALVTGVLQSSSATTVMVIGFVSAGLMTLPQAISVIMGANIGTTVTAQLIAFDLGKYAYLITAVGFFAYFVINKKIVKYIGQVVFSFGILFIGLNIMNSVLKPLATSAFFESLIKNISDIPVLGVLVGTLMTVVVQSSSATIAVLQNVAAQPNEVGNASISLAAAIPILFGDNIGTTITAILASIGAKVNAKRAALAHSVFNIAGTLIFIWFVPLFAKVVEFISPKGPEIEIIKRQIANAHTMFNMINTLLWLPFIWLLAKIVTFLVKGEDDSLDTRPKYLDERVLDNPIIAMDLATKELTRMTEFTKEMLNNCEAAFLKQEMSATEKIAEFEEIVDKLQYKIINYLSTMISKNELTDKQSIRFAGLMHMTADIERIGDHCENISDLAKTRKDDNLPFSDDAIDDIRKAFNTLNEMMEFSISGLSNYDPKIAQRIKEIENEVDDIQKKMRQRHFERLNKGLCNPESTVILIELINNLERIADHCNNISDAILADS